MSPQLWEVMVKLEATRTQQSLTCQECFAVIELLAQGASLGVEYERLAELARDHLSQCSDCKDALLAQLKRLEEIEK